LKKASKSWIVRWRRSVWEYLGELVLSVLSTWLVLRFFDAAAVQERLCVLRPDLLLAVGIGLAAAVAVWAIFAGILAGDFGVWLREKGEASAYSRALATPIFAYLLILVFLLFAGCPKAPLSTNFAVLLLLYALINFVTMIRNVNGLVLLWQDWQQARAKGRPTNI